MIKKIISFISLKIISPFNWTRIKFLLTGREYNLSSYHREYARRLMNEGVWIWVARRRTHLTSYLISFADWLLHLKVWAKNKFKGPRPRFGYWTHVFINDVDGTIIEAIGTGVQDSYFDDVFNCDAVACLAPTFISKEEWAQVSEKVIKKAFAQLGKHYDSVFDIADDSEVSCIELVRTCLKEVDNYEEKFKDFEQAIKIYKNLTPQMLYESKSFTVLWEVRR